MKTILTMVAAMCAIPCGACADDNPDQIASKALDSRRQIKQMHLRLSTVQSVYEANGKSTRSSDRELWLDGDRLRGDIAFTRGGDEGARHIGCKNCERTGYGITATDARDVAKQHGVLSWSRLRLEEFFDPRSLGLVPSPTGILRHSRLDSCLGNPDKTFVSFKNEKLRGTDCARISWRNLSKAEITVWIAISLGYAPIQIEAQSPSKDGVGVPKSRDLLQLFEMSRVASSGIWFPKRFRFEQWIEGELNNDEEATVQSVEINEPIDPAAFTFAGMNLGEGFYVEHSDRSKSGFWKGGKIERPQSTFLDTTPGEPAPTPVVDPARTTTRDWLVVLSVSLAALAGVWLIHRRIAAHRATP